MSRDIEQITEEIDGIIAARKELLPAIREERSRIQQACDRIGALVRQTEELIAISGEQRAEISSSRDVLLAQQGELRDYIEALDELGAEFERDTLNIGVSGAARTGKSTTLQHITGLSDRQIPSGGKYPVTAVRSEIYNSASNKAVVSFKTEQEFIEGYLAAHITNVNACLPDDEKLSVRSLADLKCSDLPEKLDGTVTVGATDSLKRLHEAKSSVSSYERFLGSSPKTIKLEEVRSYVTYPTPDSERGESAGDFVDRRYLAVKLAKISCQFPNLGDAKVALVDLPGLGEIGNSASDIHLKGLEDKVDQIFLVMRPSAEAAYVDDRVEHNLDQLQIIQPAVTRGDLIVAGINVDKEAGQEAADALRDHFKREVNNRLEDGGYQIVDYCAIDDESVSRMFSGLLERLSERMPQMDRMKFDYCMKGIDVSARVTAAADDLIRVMDRIIRSVPSSDRVMMERIDAIERAIVLELSDYAAELSDAAESDSEVFKRFTADAEQIHDEVADRIENGLFRENKEKWSELTSGSKDYYNLYRDEAKRLRYEIIDAYCGLDRFYGTHVSNFKLRVLDIVLSSCGMNRFFCFGPDDTADERISKVVIELGSTLRDDDLDNALRLLKGVNFDFRSNVFLQIEKHLAELANPEETFINSYGIKDAVSKREVLGGEGSCSDKQKALQTYLIADATEANDAILKALCEEEDCFNRYLAISIDFFNNCLFGKDEESFKQVVVRGLITNYKQYVLPDADDVSKSPVGQLAAAVKQSALEVKAGNEPAKSAVSAIANRARSQTNRRGSHNKLDAAKKVKGFVVGQVIEGVVNNVKKECAYVSVGDDCWGRVWRTEVSEERVEDVNDYLEKNQRVRVKVIGIIDNEKGMLALSIKRAKSE